MRKRRISGLYAVTPETPDTDWLAARAEAVLAGGARIVQYRNKNADRQRDGGKPYACSSCAVRTGRF